MCPPSFIPPIYLVVAIDSKTPSSLRKELIERFKASSNTSQNLPFSNHPVNSSKITPSLFTIKEGSTSHPDPLTLRGEGGNCPTRCSEPLRSKVGGPSKVSPDCAGWDRLGATCLRAADGLADGAGDGLGATCLRPADGLAPIQVLVNVDIFSEGFDCPDVEFVQFISMILMVMLGVGVFVGFNMEWASIERNMFPFFHDTKRIYQTRLP